MSDIQKFNDQIAKTLERAHKIVEKADSQFVGDPEVYGLISSIFYISANKMSGTVTQEQKSEPVIKKREPSESEIIRLQYIAKANDLYDQLCYDWLPDFEKQIPFVTRAKYEDFINRKLAHFVKSFHMPLTPDTSIEKAKEAHNQITKMFDNLSSIASQSYTANPPEKHF